MGLTNDEVQQWNRKIGRADRTYKEAKKQFHLWGGKVKEHGPHSYEAEVGYPQAKDRYHKKGEELHKLKIDFAKAKGEKVRERKPKKSVAK